MESATLLVHKLPDYPRSCRVCLDINTKLHFLHSNKLAHFYAELLSSPVFVDDGMPQYICSYCKALLLKAVAFKRKCRNAASFLQDLLAKGPITPECFQNIDKTNFNLPYTQSPVIIIQTSENSALDVLDIEEQIHETISAYRPIKEELKVGDYLRDFKPDNYVNNRDNARLEGREINVVTDRNECVGSHNDNNLFDNGFNDDDKTLVVVKGETLNYDDNDFFSENGDHNDVISDRNECVGSHNDNNLFDNGFNDDDKTLVVVKEETLNYDDNDFFSENGDHNDVISDECGETLYSIKQKSGSCLKKKIVEKSKVAISKKNTCKSKVVKKSRNKQTYEQIVEIEKREKLFLKKSKNTIRRVLFDYIMTKYKLNTNEYKNDDLVNVVSDEDITADNSGYNINNLETNIEIADDVTAAMSIRRFYAYIRDIYVLKEKSFEFKQTNEINNTNLNNEQENVKNNDKETYQNKKRPKWCSRFNAIIMDQNHKERLETFGKEYNFTVKEYSFDEQKKHLAKMASRFECPIRCDKCFQGFKSQAKYENHLRLNHDPSLGPESCKVCGKRFERIRHLHLHSLLHKYQLECNECGQYYRNTSNAKVHEETHRGQVFRCELCPREFKKYKTRVYHMRVVHARVTCEICYKKIATERALVLHRSKVHVPTFPCEVCKTVFNTEQARDAHRSGSGPDDGPCTQFRACASCGVNFRTDSERQRHIDTCHSKGGVYLNPCCPCRCRGKEKIVREKTSRGTQRMCGCYCTAEKTTDEKTTEDKKKHMCEVCACCFQSPAALRIHQRIHTDERPFGCDLCGKKFRIKFTLKNHLFSHTGDRRYPCRWCDKRFLSRAGLSRHQQTVHLKLRNYQCHLCGKKFTTSTGLKIHINTVHLKMPYPKRIRNIRKVKKQQEVDKE